ncbi:MAG: SGNH/GDSL hydrolase family protein, partial [Bacteroidales bacterium]|nr:SGNH/GDSL hydrolase family protein [Bacteroidales bacterium]
GVLQIPQPPFFRLERKLVMGQTMVCGQPGLGPVRLEQNPDQLALLGDLLAPVTGEVNNFGVYGAKTVHLLAPGYGNEQGLYAVPPTANPYFVRFASSPSTTILADAMAKNPTFFTLWIGNNDVLGYALTGGLGDTITSPQWFQAYLGMILQTLTSNGAKGAIANIPSVTSIPFFNTVPYNGLVLSSQAQVDGLNAAYSQLGITFNLGQNPFIIADATSPAGLRQIKNTELISLAVSQDSLTCGGWGSMKPIPEQYTLNESEINNISSAIQSYNQIISDFANQMGLAYVDVYSELILAENGIVIDGVSLSTELVTGNTFSLDGVHLTPVGNAYVANLFIRAINEKFGATLPLVNITEYDAVILP